MASQRRAFSPFGTFVQLEPRGTITPITVDTAFWVGLRDRRIDGFLVGAVRISRNFSWEMHPDGDELLYVLEGAIEIVQENDGDQHSTDVPAGRAWIIPRGVWHRVIVREPGKLLFFTPGPRTEHRPARQSSRRTPRRARAQAAQGRAPSAHKTARG